MKAAERILQAMPSHEQTQAKDLVKGLENLGTLDIPVPFKKLLVAAINALQEFATPHLEKINPMLAFAFNSVLDAIEGMLK